MEKPEMHTQGLKNLEANAQSLIKYEGELDQGFAATIAKMAHGEKFLTCIQCGTCSGTCPVSHFMDFTPRKIIAMVREGFRKEVLSSLTIWLCASCYSCTADCPREIKITDVMYALKQMALQEKVYPKRFPIPVLQEVFFNYVQQKGRNSEGRLMLAVAFKTNPFRFLSLAKMGLRLWLAGRISLTKDRIRDKEGLRKLLQAVDQAKEGAAR